MCGWVYTTHEVDTFVGLEADDSAPTSQYQLKHLMSILLVGSSFEWRYGAHLKYLLL